MIGELTAITEAGARLVDVADKHVDELAARAGEHDDTNTYVGENMLALGDSGVLGACAPVEFGGLGVRSVHDILVAVSRLGRGCGSTAICANMHIVGVWHQARAWERARAQGDRAAEERGAAILAALGGGEMIVAAAASEPGGLWNVPRTELTRDADGYLLNGRKMFATNSEIADTLTVTARLLDDDGRYRHAQALVYGGAEGMTVLRDWDALGMRGSGSHTIVFADCPVPADRVRVQDPIGVPSPADLTQSTMVNFPLLGAYLGIAEAAYRITLDHAAGQARPDRGGGRQELHREIAEIEIALASVRGALERSARSVDAAAAGSGNDTDVHRMFADWQVTKLVVNREAVAVVDRCMAICGGRAFQRGHPVSRLYRDVRAGAFMQPLGAFEAYGFIGRTALGLDPFQDTAWSAL